MNQTSVEFIDTSQESIKMMQKLSKQALKDGGKVVTQILRETVPERTGSLKKAIVAWAKIDRKTGQPYMDIGYRSRTQMRKRGFKFIVNPTWFEFGVKPHVIMTKEYKETGHSSYQLEYKQKFGVIVQHPGMPAKNFLRNTVYNNVNEIRAAQTNSLAQLNNIQIIKGMSIDLGEDEEIE